MIQWFKIDFLLSKGNEEHTYERPLQLHFEKRLKLMYVSYTALNVFLLQCHLYSPSRSFHFLRHFRAEGKEGGGGRGDWGQRGRRERNWWAIVLDLFKKRNELNLGNHLIAISFMGPLRACLRLNECKSCFPFSDTFRHHFWSIYNGQFAVTKICMFCNAK